MIATFSLSFIRLEKAIEDQLPEQTMRCLYHRS